MNGNLDSINLFKGYTQEENANTHAFLAFLNYLLCTDKKMFMAIWRSLKFGGSKIDTKDIEINCLKQNFGGTWDGQIFSKTKKWLIAIESKINRAAVNPSQLRRHKQNIKRLKKQCKNVKLIFLTPFDKDWIIKEYFHGKREQNIKFLSWGDVYKSATEIKHSLSDHTQGFVVDQYKLYLEAANGNRSGIIQIVSKEYINDDYIRGVKAGKINMFHIPSKKIGFDLPNFKVFIYDREKDGIFSYFTSNGMYLNPEKKHEKSFKHYFEIESFKELKTPITPLDIRKLLGKKEIGGNYKNFKKNNCPAPYYVLNAKMVDALENEANRRC